MDPKMYPQGSQHYHPSNDVVTSPPSSSYFVELFLGNVRKLITLTNLFANAGVIKGTELHIGASGSEVELTATPAELNKYDGSPAEATFVIGAEAANVINVGIQLNDGNAAALAARGSLFAYLSDDANGDSIAGTAPDGGWAIGTDGVLIPVVANKAAQLVSESDGDIDIDITESGTDTWYLILVMPNGTLVASEAITFAT